MAILLPDDNYPERLAIEAQIIVASDVVKLALVEAPRM